METFRVRLNCIDHYQAVPNDQFDPPVPRASLGENVRVRPKVSVIRVFGATETGQKVLMHVHGAFQYTYVEYSGSLVPEDVEVAIRTLQISIDHALAVSYRKNVYEGRNIYVAHISLVKGIPFYGYHVGYKFYLKIYLLNPLHMTRLADLLRVGAVMKRVLQPYESHMQYLAQWMCDYNLYGCAYIDCARVKFRGPVPDYFELSSSSHKWHNRSIPSEYISTEENLTKQSHCSLEVDVCVRDIINRSGVELRSLHHDFIERIRPLPIDAKLVQSMAGLWRDETRRRKARMGLSDLKSSPFPPEVLITLSADPRNTKSGGWIHEEEYREKISQLAQDEESKRQRSKPSFENFVKPVPLESSIKTALESVEDLYPENFDSVVDEVSPNPRNSEGGALYDSQMVVDESRIHKIADDYSSESEVQAPIAKSDQPLSKHVTRNSNQHSSLKSACLRRNGMSPVSPSDLEKYGIRKAGDFSHVNDDAFRDPDDLVEDSAFQPMVGKLDQDAETRPKKRRKVPVDEGNQLQEMTLKDTGDKNHATITLVHGFSSKLSPRADNNSKLLANPGSQELDSKARGHEVGDSQVLSAARMSRSQQSLSFPIVKDPNDPQTILRLSQQSGSSQKQGGTPPQSRPSNNHLTPIHLGKSQTSSQRMPTTENTGASSKSQASILLSLRGLSSTCCKSTAKLFQPWPPSFAQVQSTMGTGGLPETIYQDAYYSVQKDVPERPREYAGREFKLESATVPYLPDFEATGTSLAAIGRKVPILLDHTAEDNTDRKQRRLCKLRQWNIAETPPLRSEVNTWLNAEAGKRMDSKQTAERAAKTRTVDLSQIEEATQKKKHGYKYSQKQVSSNVQHETQYMSMMGLEVHVNTRGSLAPNPEEDEIQSIFWCLKTDADGFEANEMDGMHLGIVTVYAEPGMAKKISRSLSVDVDEEATELDALTKMVDIVRFYDPDILTGYEVHNSSWGYLIERARFKYDMNLCDEFSRMKSLSHGHFGKANDKWGFNHTSTIRITGRHTINVWRAMRGELNLLQYTLENVCFHLLHRRIPHYSFADLTKWYRSSNLREFARALEYYTSRVRMDLEILETNELVPRTSEQARLLGVDWFSVISRGSQFKVESLMFRIAKPENFILVSPSRRQVGGQNALECLPLVMEPQSDFYTSPLLVLDFQSLYPSVMIAYNYCYSTFLGRVVGWRGTNKMGFTDYRREEGLIELLKDHINIAPNGIMYAKTEIRKSLLAKMLSEILETRVMVKSGMKVDKEDKTLQALLNNRQLALKLIANVTYGYTSASFSGRMPCSEIADSIVQTARETLEKAIALIHSVDRWGAEVVYGDTDSLFVYLKGRTREQAFDIGEDIAATITKLNPRPVKLKFEKVYHPCVLLAKKRYVGFKYEHRNQTTPYFDAKGIETVRRDGTPAEQKIEENALKILFRTSDLSQVKSFFQAQCSKVMRGEVSVQDFCFAKEVRLGTYSEKAPPPPGALISTRRMLEDPRLEPQYGERVPYVVVTGAPGARLIDRCVAPEVLLNDAQAELDSEYYISKNWIPPLERIFNLVGANVRHWYDEMPKYQRIRKVEAGVDVQGREVGMSKKTMESYMKSSTCLVCTDPVESELSLCNSCLENASQSLLRLRTTLARQELKAAQLAKICRSCSGLSWNEQVRCDSKDCPVFYSRTRQKAGLENTKAQVLPMLTALEDRTEAKLEW